MARGEATLCVTQAGFAIVGPGGVQPVGLADIASITAYKRDELVTDLLCWDVEIGSGESARTITLHEELPGFDAVTKACEALPGFDDGWRGAVLRTPFQANATQVYRCAH